jgi:hypothetical protein
MARRITTGTLGRTVLGSILAENNSLVSIITNDNIILDPNGSGLVETTADIKLSDNTAVRLHEETTNGSNYVALKSPAAVTTTATYTLPDGNGITNEYYLRTDASGNLSWDLAEIEISDTVDAGEWYPVITQTTSDKVSAASVSSTKLSLQPSTGNLTVAGQLAGDSLSITTNGTFGATSRSADTVVRALAGDGNACGFEAYGASQGTGYYFVGQSQLSNGYGGGMFYNGDGSPAFAAGEAADYNCFYRVSAGTKTVTARYYYNDNNWYFHGHILPNSTTNDLGSSGARWRNIYTSDLNLSNGIGDYTMVEGEEDLFLYNNKSGKVFKFALIEVDASEAPPKIEDLEEDK